MANILKLESDFLCEPYCNVSTKDFIQNEINKGTPSFIVYYIPTYEIFGVEKLINNGQYILYNNEFDKPIIGYSKAGLKISDPDKKIKGKITILPSKHLDFTNKKLKDGSIIYEPNTIPFNKERDSYLYIYGSTIYTDEPIEDIIKDYMSDGRDSYVFLGEYTLCSYQLIEVLKRVTPDELCETINFEKKKVLIKK